MQGIKHQKLIVNMRMNFSHSFEGVILLCIHQKVLNKQLLTPDEFLFDFIFHFSFIISFSTMVDVVNQTPELFRTTNFDTIADDFRPSEYDFGMDGLFVNMVNRIRPFNAYSADEWLNRTPKTRLRQCLQLRQCQPLLQCCPPHQCKPPCRMRRSNMLR